LGTLCLALEEQKTMIIERLKSGVITVGHGRGFVVEGAGERLVITAAHCLPSLPPALLSFGLEARTYGPLLARLVGRSHARGRCVASSIRSPTSRCSVRPAIHTPMITKR
jgi:hypothetical protein